MLKGGAWVSNLEPLAGHDLKDVAGPDVLLAVPHDLLVFLAREVGARLERDRSLGVDIAQLEFRSGSRQPRDQLVDAVGRRLVGFPWVGAGFEMRLGHHEHGLANVVEEDHAVEERKREVGQAPVVARDVGQVFGVADRVVGGVADGAAGEPGQAAHIHRAIAIDELLELAEGIGRLVAA